MRELIKRYRFFLFAVILILMSVILYSYNLRQKSSTTFFERAVLTFTAPFQNGLDSVVDRGRRLWSNYIWLVDARQRNLALEHENRELKAKLGQADEILLQNIRLRKLLTFIDELDKPALPAEVIGEDASSWSRTVIINKGTRAGLREGFPVVSADGVVGRIIKTAPTSSRVLLITDASSAIATLVQRTRTRGVVRGRGEDLSLEFALRDRDVLVGDLLVTSGMGGVFPKGLPIGRVTRVEKDSFSLFQQVWSETTTDFSHLEEVFVIVGEGQ